jgi:hypothetical protein
MRTVQLKALVGEDGILRVELPAGVTRRMVDVVVVFQVRDEEVDERGWPIGYFERTYGALADDPIERPEQLPLEIREAID